MIALIEMIAVNGWLRWLHWLWWWWGLGCEGCEWPPGPRLANRRLTGPGITFTSVKRERDQAPIIIWKATREACATPRSKRWQHPASPRERPEKYQAWLQHKPSGPRISFTPTYKQIEKLHLISWSWHPKHSTVVMGQSSMTTMMIIIAKDFKKGLGWILCKLGKRYPWKRVVLAWVQLELLSGPKTF